MKTLNKIEASADLVQYYSSEVKENIKELLFS